VGFIPHVDSINCNPFVISEDSFAGDDVFGDDLCGENLKIPLKLAGGLF
jgi:hypothetical protein